MARVPVLDSDGRLVDLRGIGEHQDRQVFDIGAAAVFAVQMAYGHEIAIEFRDAERRRADKNQLPWLEGREAEQGAGDDAAEGKSADVDGAISARCDRQTVRDRVRVGHELFRMRGPRRLAKTRRVRRDDGAFFHEGGDRADPVHPRARSSVKQEKRREVVRALAPHAPAHGSAPAGRVDLAGLCVERPRGLRQRDLRKRHPIRLRRTGWRPARR